MGTTSMSSMASSQTMHWTRSICCRKYHLLRRTVILNHCFRLPLTMKYRKPLINWTCSMLCNCIWPPSTRSECPAKSRSVFSGLLDGTLDLLIASTATPSTATPLLTSEYEMSKLGIEIVGHLLQCPELAIKVWKSDQPLPRRIIHVAQKVPQLRAAAVQLLHG